ncbi:cellulose biosynthesis protein BcsN [Martelella alba]|uniref:Cellulose biosynthesis protein BcsN n=1 Tax=Martelella alba TaxID=2590451 RepID=A0A506UGS8_9HYPH|nr:cellulose biosynthesis protein BcsN [Martelella alba]TPW32459.1 cellulose biosynthesis protein BcsN [Martelella alba]
MRQSKAGTNGTGLLCGAAAIGLSLLLSACAGPVMPYGAATRTALPEDALVMPPPGGPAIVSVLEHQYSNALQQRILLTTNARTQGQNYIQTQFFGVENYSRLNGQSLAYHSVNETNIAETMREEIPGVVMKQSPYYVQNNYGPFGYAFGYGRGNDLCMYGWQQIRPGRDTRQAFGQAGTIQIRVRFCETGASEDDLLGIMYGYTINGAVEAYGWNPYGDANSPPPLLGKTGAPTYPKQVYDDRKDNLARTSTVLPSSTTKRTVTSTTRTVSTAAPVTNSQSVTIIDQPEGAVVTRAPALPPATAPAAAIAPASTIPAPERQIPAATAGAPASTAGTAAQPTSGSIPGPPCRLLPGSTTVTCN